MGLPVSTSSLAATNAFIGFTLRSEFKARFAQRTLKFSRWDSIACLLPATATALARGMVRSPIFAPTSITVLPSRKNFRINETSDSLYCPYKSRHFPMKGPENSIHLYLQAL